MNHEALSSRERVVRVLNHEPVDRVPIDLGGHTATGISAFAYWHLRKTLGLSTNDIRVHDAVQLTAHVDDDVLNRFHADVVNVSTGWPKEAVWSPREPYSFRVPAAMTPEAQADGSWVVRRGGHRMRMPAGGYFFDGAWLSNWGAGERDADLAAYAVAAERLYKETPYALNFTGHERGCGFGAFFGGIDRAVEMLLDPEAVMAQNEAVLRASVELAGHVIDGFGQYVQVLSLSDDMGLQDGPACRPSVMEQCVFPYLKRFCAFVHGNSDIKVLLHTCGSIKPLIPLLIEAGVDALNPVQISAANMDPRELACAYGNDVVFWGGGCNTQTVLPTATPGEVAEHVRELVGAFAAGHSGGFVFSQVHNVMGDVAPQNVIAMLDAAYDASFCTQTVE